MGPHRETHWDDLWFRFTLFEGIIASRMKGVASCDSAQGEDTSLYNSIFHDGQACIG